MRSGRMRSAFYLGVVDRFERCLIEVAADVRVRIEEEALGATLHGRMFKNSGIRI